MANEGVDRAAEAEASINPYASPRSSEPDRVGDEELEVAERVLWRRVRWARWVLFLIALFALIRIPSDPWNAGVLFVSLGVASLISRNAPLAGLVMGFAALLPSWTLAFGEFAVQYDLLLSFPGGFSYYEGVFSRDSLMGIVATFAVNAALATVIWRAIAAAARLVGREEGSWGKLRPGLVICTSFALLGVFEYLSQGWLGDYAEALEFAWAAACVPVIWGARGEWLGLLRGRRIKGSDLLYAAAGLLALYAVSSECAEFAGKIDVELPDPVGWYLAKDFSPALILVLLVGWVPLVEELVFRGFLQSRLERLMTPGYALVVQAALYAGVHGVEGALLTHAVIGITAGWLRHRTRNLYVPLVLHIGHSAWFTLSALQNV